MHADIIANLAKLAVAASSPRLPQVPQQLSKTSCDRIVANMQKTAGLKDWWQTAKTLFGGHRRATPNLGQAARSAAPVAAHADPAIARTLATGMHPDRMIMGMSNTAQAATQPIASATQSLHMAPPASIGNAMPGVQSTVAPSPVSAPGWFRPRNLAIGAGVTGLGGTNLYNNLSQNSFYSGEGGPTSMESAAVPSGRNAPGATSLEYSRNMEALNRQRAPLERELDRAHTNDDTAAVTRLQRQLDTGDYGGSSWFNPARWVGLGERPASYHMGQAHEAQNYAQRQLNTALGAFGPREGDARQMADLQRRLQSSQLLPHQTRRIEADLERIRQRMGQSPGTLAGNSDAEYWHRIMQNAGMRVAPGTLPNRTTGPVPAAHWNMSNLYNPWAINSFGDVQSEPRPWAGVLNQPNGPLTR